MTQEDKDLLLRDLCARLPYGVKVKVVYRAEYPDENDIEGDFILNEIDTRCSKNLYWIGGDQLQERGISRNVSSFATCSDDDDEIVKPYLFPLSSMTEGQKKELKSTMIQDFFGIQYYTLKSYDYLYKNHIDIRGLIPMDLAIDATNLNVY